MRWLISASALLITNTVVAPVAPSQTVQTLSKAVLTLRPGLSSTRVAVIATSALHAGRKFGVDPQVLVAISFQESSFRNSLPTGLHGEEGLLQIRYSVWAANPQLRRVFGRQDKDSFVDITRQFYMAAWLISTFKAQRPEDNIGYYNGVAPRARRVYRRLILKHLTKIRESV